MDDEYYELLKATFEETINRYDNGEISSDEMPDFLVGIVKAINGDANCPECSAPIDADDGECEECGAAL